MSTVDPSGVFTSLAEIAREASTPKEMYAAICVAATLTVPGCDHASLMICHDGACSTVAVSDQSRARSTNWNWRWAMAHASMPSKSAPLKFRPT